LIERSGMQPYVVDGAWDGYSMTDTDGLRRIALMGAMEREARHMAAAGYWGAEVQRAELERRRARRVRRRVP
jgi:hypothetical protein